jgi:hypothetical protein
MKNEFVPYELALKLKQLGFDEPCFAGYRGSEWIGTDGPNSRYFHSQLFSNHQFDEDQKEYCSSPLFQQAFRWFRKKEFLIDVTSLNSNEYEFYIQWSFAYSHLSDIYKTYEEAEIACLDKLIEIVKLT